VEEDGMMTPDSESVPFGISMTKGDSSMIPVSRGSSSSSACSDPDSFKVAIIDSGVEADHPDIPCRDINDLDTNCKGISIGIGDLPWYAPTRRAGHGTHVFGTIGAIGGNDEGVAGMVPDSAGICYLIARVSDDDSNVVYASTVFEAIDWAITQGANVINLSLGGATFYQAGQNLIDKAHENGALTVATAGNSGSENLHYPGSFDHVLSVAAVDADGTGASFSQQNEKVDVAAPGVGIVSTYIGGGYVAATGTSMAAPHVTGAIAKVWSVCRQCSNAQVETCLLTTASGAPSRTNQLGFGIVNAEDTYECLVNTDGCCAETTQLRIQSIRQREPNLLVQKTQESEPVQEVEVARVAECTRRKPGEQCRRGAHCCSGECVGQWGARTCKAA
jgi:serine protease